MQTTRVFAEIEKGITLGATTISEQGSSRSAKTYNTLIWLISHCGRVPGTRVSVVRSSLPALRRSVLQDFREIMERAGWWEESRFSKSELTYIFRNGSTMEFFSTDSEQKLRGSKRDVLFVNEANELRYLEWQQLKMRTTRLTILDYNPSFSDEHWICRVNADPRTYHFITTYRDNPFLEQTVIDEIESLREMNPALWRIYGLGLQSQVEGLVFPTFDTVPEIPSAVRRRWGGIDFGFTNDPTAIVEVATDMERLWLREHAYRTHMLTSEIISELKRALPRHRIISESADPRLVEEIYRAGIDIRPVRKFAGSVEAGLMKMAAFRLCVTSDSLNLIKELKNYCWRTDKEGARLNQPVDAWNHAIDAARYVVMQELMGGERRPIDLARLSRLV